MIILICAKLKHTNLMISTVVGFLLLFNLNTAMAETIKLNKHPEIVSYINYLAKKYHFSKKALVTLYQKVELHHEIIDRINTPYESKPWYQYKRFFITQSRIADGVSFFNQYKTVLQKVSQRYNIPPEIIVAIIGIETDYGKYAPSYRAIDALTTLAFQYPKRYVFFKKELTELMLLSREEKVNPLKFI